MTKSGSDNGGGGTEAKAPSEPTSLITAAAAVIAAVGALAVTGALGRVQRNNGLWFGIGIGAVLLGATLWIIASVLSAGTPTQTDAAAEALNASASAQKDAASALKASEGTTKGSAAEALSGGAAAEEKAAAALQASKAAQKDAKGAISRRKWSQLAQIVGVIAVALGIVLSIYTAIDAAQEIEQPAVTLKLSDDATSIVGTVRVGDLSSNDRLNVFIDGLRLVNGKAAKSQTAANGQPKDIYGAPTILYEAYVGPNGDGLATEDITVAVPPAAKRFDAVDIRAFTAQDAAECGREPLNTKGHSGTGCAIIQLPRQPMTPELSASLDPAAKTSVVKVGLRATSVSVGKVALLQAVSLSHRSVPTTLFRATSTATPAGTISRDVRIPVPTHVHTVCVGAQFTDARHSPRLVCPTRPQSVVTTVQIRVPDP